jgi:4-hydroxy-tetrahydrodipicolinate synthase
MSQQRPRGVIAAIATAVTESGAPDHARSVDLARFLLGNGCDGLNVLGTTGEATSFSLQQRQGVMDAYHKAGLPMHRLLVGTGAAALADAIALSRHAANLGFAGALVLPPFYYKGVPDDGLFAYVNAIVSATADTSIPIYLYHFPGMSGVPWTLGLVGRLRAAFGPRIAGLKDSSGDLPYARQAATIASDFDVLPSNEATLLAARKGEFAGCISATANLNADLCARAYHRGDAAALETAVAIRKLFDGKPLVAGVKALLAHIHHDPAWNRVAPPLAPFAADDAKAAISAYDGLRARGQPGARARASA